MYRLQGYNNAVMDTALGMLHVRIKDAMIAKEHSKRADAAIST